MSQDSLIKIAIVDDHLIMRQGLMQLLAKHPRFVISGDYNNGQELLEDIPKQPPHLVLLDIEMPVMNGKDTLIQLKKSHPHLQVIMLSLHFSNLYVQQFFELGARGFLSKGTDVKVLIEAIEEVHDGGVFFSDNVSRYSINELINNRKISPKVDDLKLNENEIQILRLLCLEKSSKEIGSELNLSERTVENYRQKLMTRTKSKNVIGLIIYAFYNQLLNIKDFPKSGTL